MEISSVIGVDMGASNIRAARVENGQIVARAASKLPLNKDYQAVIDTLFATINEVNAKKVSALGIGVPSVVERKNGIVYNVQNIPSWQEVPLKQILENQYQLSVEVNNDANCFALGERVFGAGKEYENFVGLAIGTGVGGGIINNGKLLLDVNCGSGEFGEIPYLDSRYEDYCSSLFFQHKYKQSAKEVFAKAEQGDKEAQAICAEFGHHLGKLLYTITLAIDPEAILLGGSIAKAYVQYQDSMWKVLQQFPYPKTIEKLTIKCTETPEIQILGSAALCYI